MKKRALLVVAFLATSAVAQSAQPQGFGICKPIAQRTRDVGCWIASDDPIGPAPAAIVYWHVDEFASRADAERNKTSRSSVMEAFGKVWLLTIDRQDWRPAHGGKHAASVGPLHVTAGRNYSTLLMQNVLDVGMTSAIHLHSGPEAWYTIAGETCLETPDGKHVERAGASSLSVEAHKPMLLTATGKTQRRALALILHPTDEPPTTMVHNWKPKGLCK